MSRTIVITGGSFEAISAVKFMNPRPQKQTL